MRPILLHQATSLHALRGCAKLAHPKMRQPTDTQTSQHTVRVRWHVRILNYYRTGRYGILYRHITLLMTCLLRPI
jgi:hypothetical protein